MPSSVILKEGALYISNEMYGRFFAGLEAVILLRRESDLLILPVRHAAAGGYLLKIRNRTGDRVVNAPDFFRENGLGDASTHEFSVTWSNDRAALVAAKAFGL